MAIEEIQYGSLASSALVNSNFNELQNQISALALRVTALEESKTTMSNTISNLQTRVKALEDKTTGE